MNIIEAIKSGKPFRRCSWRNYVEGDEFQVGFFMSHNYDPFSPSKVDILADDWELKPDEPITITREQFWSAYQSQVDKVNQGLALESRREAVAVFNVMSTLINHMAKALGVEK